MSFSTNDLGDILCKIQNLSLMVIRKQYKRKKGCPGRLTPFSSKIKDDEIHLQHRTSTMLMTLYIKIIQLHKKLFLVRNMNERNAIFLHIRKWRSSDHMVWGTYFRYPSFSMWYDATLSFNRALKSDGLGSLANEEQ